MMGWQKWNGEAAALQQNKTADMFSLLIPFLCGCDLRHMVEVY